MSQPHTHLHHQLQLVGQVDGIRSCHVVSDEAEIVVGSARSCDMVVPDPMVPARAFKLVFVKNHHGPRDACECTWWLKPIGGARLCVNGSLAGREPIRAGDVIGIGCHTIRVEEAPARTRNAMGIVQVDDVCRRLIENGQVPVLYLSALPSSAYRQRMWYAGKAALAAVLVLAALMWLWPREPEMEPAMPPMEIVMLEDQATMPSADAVRDLETVQRQTVDEATTGKPDLAEQTPAPLESLTPQPLLNRAELASEPTTPPRITSSLSDVGPAQDAVQLAGMSTLGRVDMEREKTLANTSAPRRRLTMDEAASPAFAAELAKVDVQVERVPVAARFRKLDSTAAGAVIEKPAAAINTGQRTAITGVDPFTPSKLDFTTHRGQKIPVAHAPAKLEQLADATEGFQPDGQVTENEIAASWKSGQFVLHAPGQPPKATPATFCYVSQTTLDNVDYLYVSFICTDPDTSRIITNKGNNDEMIIKDDSVEIFLDVDGNRVDFHQMIVNARGNFWSAYYARPGENGPGIAAAWNVSPRIKTHVDAKAKQWTVEIFIPFSQLPGGTPRKGDQWAVNFCRNFRGQVNDDQLQTWFLVFDGSRNFHNPDLFGVFTW